MNFEDLSDELKAKAQACKTPEEILALAKEKATSWETMKSRRSPVVCQRRW